MQPIKSHLSVHFQVYDGCAMLAWMGTGMQVDFRMCVHTGSWDIEMVGLVISVDTKMSYFEPPQLLTLYSTMQLQGAGNSVVKITTFIRFYSSNTTISNMQESLFMSESLFSSNFSKSKFTLITNHIYGHQHTIFIISLMLC